MWGKLNLENRNQEINVIFSLKHCYLVCSIFLILSPSILAYCLSIYKRKVDLCLGCISNVIAPFGLKSIV